MFDFGKPAITKREVRKARCGSWFTKVAAYFKGFINFQIYCGIYQGPNACPVCRQTAVIRETANASEAGSWLYWAYYLYSPNSLKWKADRMWMRRRGIRYRWCHQDDGTRFMLVENSHPGIPGLQQVKVQDIDWNAVMDRMPEGSSFRGPLRTTQASKEDKRGYVTIWQKQVQVKALPGVQAEAQRLAMSRTLSLIPTRRTIEELEAMTAELIGFFEEELAELGGKIVASWMVKVRVNLDLIDWLSYSPRPTLARGYDPMLVPSGYAVVA